MAAVASSARAPLGSEMNLSYEPASAGETRAPASSLLLSPPSSATSSW
ncbi:Uncharacterised protein [Mycobacteroides abscessus subsp. abscessus]|nr:Uncharacterised protein [Mycobacteroides abscessus subsp. abscessus]